MSPKRAWLTFERHGGMPPRDDEGLWLAEDGSFTAHRTIGGPCIGAFEGRLPAATMARIRKAAEGLDAGKDLEIPTPAHGATETLKVAGRTLQAGSNETPPKPWRGLAKAVRSVFESEVVAAPAAAVGLEADEGTARLVHAGAAPIEVDLGTLQVRVVHMGADDALRARWAGRPTEGLVDNGETMVATPRWVSAGTGWSADLPFDHGYRLGPGEWLQVWVAVAIRAGGERRAGRLYRPVIPDA